MLAPPNPLTEVEILNPIQGKDRSEDKLTILDILARDLEGRHFNIEMQTSLPTDLPKRLTYYNCLTYIRQLSEGEPYYQLRPSISICVLDRILFRNEPANHLSFRLRCDQCPLVFTNDLVFHTLELPKYPLPNDNRVQDLTTLEKWLYFLRRGKDLTPDEMARVLQEAVFAEAVGVLRMISQSPEDRLFYEARLKFLHDAEARLIAAREEGRQAGVQQGRTQGVARGSLAGKIQLVRQLLGEDEVDLDELLQLSDDALTSMLSELQGRLRARGE